MKSKFSTVIIAKFEKKFRKIDIRYQINLLTSDDLSFFFLLQKVIQKYFSFF